MGMNEEDLAGLEPDTAQPGDGSATGKVIHLFSAIPGGKEPDAHDVAAALIVAGAIVFLLLVRRHLSRGSAGHLHISGLDALIVAAYWVVFVAAAKTLVARFPDSTAAQSLAWIIA